MSIKKQKLVLRAINVCAALGLMVMLVHLSACDGDEGSPTPEKVITGKTWQVEKAMVDDVMKNDVYGGLTLKFSGSDYETTNGNPIWKNVGTWRMVPNEDVIQFDGTLRANISIIDNRKITLSFKWDDNTFSSGRTHSLKGGHEFTMIAQ